MGSFMMVGLGLSHTRIRKVALFVYSLDLDYKYVFLVILSSKLIIKIEKFSFEATLYQFGT